MPIILNTRLLGHACIVPLCRVLSFLSGPKRPNVDVMAPNSGSPVDGMRTPIILGTGKPVDEYKAPFNLDRLPISLAFVCAEESKRRSADPWPFVSPPTHRLDLVHGRIQDAKPLERREAGAFGRSPTRLREVSPLFFLPRFRKAQISKWSL